MYKKIKIILLLLIGLFLITSCAQGDSFEVGDGESGIDNSIIISSSNRKIVYTASLSIKTNNLAETTNNIKANLEEDDWIEREELTTTSNYITFRIKTDRLNDFINNLRNEFETTNFNLESKDVSLQYTNTLAKKEALLLERTRLMVLYDEASINEIIIISSRISEIDTKLIELDQTLLQFDSLVDFSTVKVWIYGSSANSNPPNYGNTLKNAFTTGWDTVVSIVLLVIQIIFFLIPFLVIVIPAGLIVLTIIYYKNKNRNK